MNFLHPLWVAYEKENIFHLESYHEDKPYELTNLGFHCGDDALGNAKSISSTLKEGYLVKITKHGHLKVTVKNGEIFGDPIVTIGKELIPQGDEVLYYMIRNEKGEWQ